MATAEKIKLEIFKVFDAPPERVFDAWLSKSLGDWIGPANVRGEVVQMEPRVGGRYRIVMHSQDRADIAVGGIYRVIDRPNRIVLSWKWEHEEQDTLIALTFRGEGSKTLLTIVHEDFASGDRRDSHNNGWNGSFEKLAEFLAKNG